MPDRTATPEELLDQWLDQLNEPGETTPPAPAAIAGLAEVALDYRRVLAPNGKVVTPERNGKMHNAQTLATSNGATWRILARPERRRIDWGSWLATAAIVALLVGLVGGAALRTWGLPGASDPTSVAGVAASPGASPVAGTLSCAAPGYAPVISGDVTAESDVDIGGSSIEFADSWMVVPTTRGPRTLPAGHPIEGAPGAYISWESDLGTTVFSTVLNQSWEFPALSLDVDVPSVRSAVTAGPYVIGPVDPSGVDYRILDVRSGDEVRVSELIGGTFPGAVVIKPSVASSLDSDVQSIQFVRASEFQDSSDSSSWEQPATGEDSVTSEAMHDTVAVVLPGTVTDAAVIDVSDISGAYGNVGPSEVVFDSERGYIAWRGWLETGTDDERFGFFIADKESLTDPMIFVPVDTPSISLPIAFSPDGSALYVLQDNTIEAIAVADGKVSQVATGHSSSVQVLSINAINRDAGTVLYSLAGRETWRLDTSSGETSRVPALDGYLIDPYGAPGFAFGTRFDLGTPGEGSMRTEAVIDTSTGRIVATHTQRTTVDGAGAWSYEQVATGERTVAELDTEGGTVAISDLSNGESWTKELPDLQVDPDTIPLAEIHTRLVISPDESCLVLNVDRETGREGTAVQGVITTEHVGTWIAPVEPGATWTKLPFDLMEWWPVPTDDARTLPAQDFATPAASTGDTGLSCVSPGYVPVVSGAADDGDFAAFGGADRVIRSTDDGVVMPLPNGETRELPPDSFVYPGSDLALAIHDDNSATVIRISTGETWQYPDVKPRVEGQPYWDFFANGRYVIGPTDDSRTDWLITDTLTGDTRTTADILGAPFEGPLDLWTQSSSESGDFWLLQFMTLTIPGEDETPPAVVDAPGYIVIPSSLDDAWVSDSPVRAKPVDTVVSPEGTSYIVIQTVRDAKTGERVDSGEDNLTFFGQLIGYLDEDTLLTWRQDTLNTVDIHTAVATPVYTAPDIIQSVAWDRDAGTLAVGSGNGNTSTWALVDLATGEATRLPDLDGYQLANVSTFGPAGRVDGAAAFIDPQDNRDIFVRALDTRTGAVSEPVTTRTDTRVSGLESRVPAWDQERFVRTTDEAGTTTFIDAASGTTVVLPIPDGVTVPEGGRLDISVVPDGDCAVLTPLGSDVEPAGNTWIAPIEPGATWTELPFELDGWWKLPTDEAHILPAQDIATPDSFVPDVQVADRAPLNLRERPATDAEIVANLSVGTPLMTLGDEEDDEDGEQWVRVRTESGVEGWVMTRYLEPYGAIATPAATPEGAALSCASPGYRAVVRGSVDPDALPFVGNVPIDLTSNTITAANGTEITFDADEEWLPYPFTAVGIVVSGKDPENPDTVTSLVTGQSWSWPDLAPNVAGPGYGFNPIGSWLILPVNEHATDWRIINTDTGEERLTSDLLGSVFPTPHSVSVNGPWTYDGSTATIVGFSSAEGDMSAIVLPSGELDDAWALDPANTGAAMTGAITADGTRIAYIDPMADRVVVLDGFTGDHVGYFRAPDAGGAILQPVGLTNDDAKLILRDNQQVWTVDLASGKIATVFDPGGDIHEFSFDPTTGTAIASSGDGPEEHYIWIDPATGESKELDIPLPMRFPQPQFGWALIQTRDDIAVDYALLDMTSGEIVTDPIGADRDENGANVWITGGDDNGVFVIQAETGRMLVLDGPGGQSFALTAPEDGRDGWNGVSIGVSPNGGCLVYTEVGRGEEPGTSWIAPLEPDAEWTELPFELGPWIEMPPAPEMAPATPDATETPIPTVTPFADDATVIEPIDADHTPAPDSTMTPEESSAERPIPTVTPFADDAAIIKPLPPTAPAATADPDIVSMLPDGAIPVVATDDPGAVDQDVFATVGGLGPDSSPGMTIPLRSGEVLELPDAIAIAQLPLTPVALVTNDDGSRLTIDLISGDTLVDVLPSAVEGEQWVGHYLLIPGRDGTTWNVIDLLTGDQTDTATLGDGPFDREVTVVPMPAPADAPRNVVVQFAFEMSTGDLMPWQGLATDVGPPSGTLVIPGSVDDARFLVGTIGSTDPLHPVVAISDGDAPLISYTTPNSEAVVVLEDAATGEDIATWSARDLTQRQHPLYLAGFAPDGNSVVAWLGWGGYGPAFIHELRWSDEGPETVSTDLGMTNVEQVVAGDDIAFVAVMAEPEPGSAGPARSWKLLDLESGEATDLPELDGMLLHRYVPGDPWMIFNTVDLPLSSSIVVVDAATGEVAVRLDDPDLGVATARSSSRDGGMFVVTGHTGDEHSTGYVIDAASGESWELEPPFDGQVRYGVSPDGSVLTASTDAGDGWIAPVADGAAWVPLPEGRIVTWLALPERGE